MNRIKVWPHMTILAVVVALVAGIGAAFWMKHEQTASAEELPYAARIQRVEGEVAFSDGLPDTQNTDAGAANQEWVAASANQPFSVGDRIYTRDNSRTSLAFSGRNFARLDPNTSLDVVSLSDRRTQLALRDGSAMFDVGYLQPDELFEVATPNGAVSFDQPGLYNVGFDNNGGVLVSVLSGLAQVFSQGGSANIGKGEMLTLAGQMASELVLSRLNGEDAGRQVDDYYRYQYPNSYDGRYNDYNAYLSDPNYYDPYRRNAGYQYANSSIPGVNDLDAYGDWQNVDGYGNAWRPRVDSGWVPYQQGQWTNDYPYGPTWVSSEPWGYAPYHYGRWANVGNQWYWIPDARDTRPAYAPALVAFVPTDDSNQIGWVPLGPGDSYAPRYYDANWQPRYLTRDNLSPAQLINLGIPGAVSVVQLDAFGRHLDSRNFRRIDQQRLTANRATLDPLTLTPLRNAVINSAWGRGKISLPPGIAKKLNDTHVYIGRDVSDSKFRKNLAKSMRVDRVSDDARNRKSKVKDNREAKDDRREARQLEKQQQDITREQVKTDRAEVRSQDKAERKAAQQPQGDRVSNPAKSEAKPNQQPQGTSKPGKKQNPPAHPNGHGEGGGRGKGKGKP
ncbi:MAG TPA: DUF6600 domain-containing protein [Pyrinomonadaceae bacterium]|nr:DUF6600 domain-containing protein [Pyrinomonadaceae bacterium]